MSDLAKLTPEKLTSYPCEWDEDGTPHLIPSAEVMAEIRRRLERLEQCEADSSRLDWLAEECTMAQLSKIWMHSDPNAEAFRAAIDAARAAVEDKWIEPMR